MKYCSKCETLKAIIEFGKDKNRQDGLKNFCKICRNAENLKLRRANPEVHRKANLAYAQSPEGKYKQWSNNLRRKFWPHLSNEQAVDEYNKLLGSQNDACGLCKKPATMFKTRLAVDHCHTTLTVRGLLCNKCNRFEVGRHTIDTAKQMLEYLLKSIKV